MVSTVRASSRHCWLRPQPPAAPVPVPDAQRQVLELRAMLQSGPPSVASTRARPALAVRSPSMYPAATLIAVAVGVEPPGELRSSKRVSAATLPVAGLKSGLPGTEQVAASAEVDGNKSAPMAIAL